MMLMWTEPRHGICLDCWHHRDRFTFGSYGKQPQGAEGQAVQATHRLAILLDEGPVLVFNACRL